MTDQETTPFILVIGESLTDVVRAGPDESRHAGGSPLNVACGLANLGVRTYFLTSIGTDRDGTVIADRIAASGAKLIPGSTNTERTSTAIATIQEDGSAAYTFDIKWRLPDVTGIRITKWVHVGSLATFIDPGAGALERLLQTLDGHSIVTYDPNIRPSIIGDHRDAVARFERFAGLATVVKLSAEDAAWIYPQLSEDFVVGRIHGLGARVVALTRGPDGARLSTAATSIDVLAPKVKLVDTIGAGDSFMATFVYELRALDSLDIAASELRRIGERAVTAASFTCEHAGARLPTSEELDAIWQGR